MIELAHISEFYAKLIFGIHLTLSFSGVSNGTDKKAYFGILFPLLSLLTLSLWIIGEENTIAIYPLLIHFPLILYLYKKIGNPLLHALISLFFAFQFLSPRLWLGVSVANLFGNDPVHQDFTIILLQIPFSWVIDRYFAPEIAAFKDEDKKMMFLIGLAPICYYIMTYTMVIYSDILLSGGSTLVDFIDGIFILSFLVYTVFSLKILQEKKEIEVERAVLLILAQSNRLELSQLHQQEELVATYQHDLRHHVHYLDKLIEKNKVEEAREYLKTILLEQEKQVIYASDESVMLLIAQFQRRGKHEGIYMEVEVETSDFSGFDQLKLCGLLSNALENALKFSKEHEKPKVFLKIHRNQGRLTLYIKNNYAKLPEFHNLRPITKEQGHGYGTKSMAMIVEQYNGFSQFSLEYGYFIFHATLMAERQDL